MLDLTEMKVTLHVQTYNVVDWLWWTHFMVTTHVTSIFSAANGSTTSSRKLHGISIAVQAEQIQNLYVGWLASTAFVVLHAARLDYFLAHTNLACLALLTQHRRH